MQLENYHFFASKTWDMGALSHALTYQNQAVSEAILFGISGGIAAGYFVFEYKDQEPSLHFLTRNTLDPFDRVLDRCGIETTWKRSIKPDKAFQNLQKALEANKVPIVWADAASLPYNALDPNGMYHMLPIIVYGIEGEEVLIADRSKVSLTASTDDLAKARSRIANNKNQLLLIDLPHGDRIPTALLQGLQDCVHYMTEAPPLKPMQGKFGLVAFERWAQALMSPRKDGWEKQFAPGPAMLSGMLSAYNYIHLWESGHNGARSLFEKCLRESADLLNKPDLESVAKTYRMLVTNWADLGETLLPESISAFAQLRNLMNVMNIEFINNGNISLAERLSLREKKDSLIQELKNDFPMDEKSARRWRENLKDRILDLGKAESEAIHQLKTILDD